MMESAIARERAMKKWLRRWKLELVEHANPEWRDLWPDIAGGRSSADIPAGASPTVIPAHAGIRRTSRNMDPRVRGDDGLERNAT